MKICTSCKEEKQQSDFHKNGLRLRSECKVCISSKKSKHYYQNRISMLEKKRDYWEKNKSKISPTRKKYMDSYTKENKSRLSAYHKDWAHERRQNDVEFRIKENLRSRLRMALKKNLKTGSAIRDLGCSVGALKSHLENQFQPGMSWENYGEWHIDHIVPLSAFDLTNEEEHKKACHYSNLQPLWEGENLRKGAKIT